MDAFTISWDSWYFYAFPPFCQIHRCLQKILKEQVPQGIMILSHWPTQVWWPQLLRMMIAMSFVLPRHQDLLSLSHSPQTLHPLREKADYAGMSPVWQSIQDRGISKAAARLIMASWRDGTKNSTVPTSQNGKTFVIRGK